MKQMMVIEERELTWGSSWNKVLLRTWVRPKTHYFCSELSHMINGNGWHESWALVAKDCLADLEKLAPDKNPNDILITRF